MVKGILMPWYTFSMGVSQDSILGPFPFLVHKTYTYERYLTRDSIVS